MAMKSVFMDTRKIREKSILPSDHIKAMNPTFVAKSWVNTNVSVQIFHVYHIVFSVYSYYFDI